MKIAHVVKSDSSYSDEERYALNLAVAQHAHGSRVMIVANTHGSFTRACLDHGLQVAVVRDVAQGRLAAIPDEDEIGDLVDQLLVFDAEIVHCHHPSFMMQSVFAAKRCGLPLVITLQVEPALTYRFLELAKQQDIYPVALSFSQRDIKVLKKRGVPEASLYYVPGGTSSMSPARLGGENRSSRPGLVLSSALTFKKGVDVAVLAMAELRARLGPRSPELNIYGEGNYGPYHEEMVTTLGLDDVIHFHGHRADALALHASPTDILLMPSREETGPLVVLEAMSLGMPIVATDVGDVAQMLPDRSYGRVVPVNSIRGLADAIESLLIDIAAGRFAPALLIERHRSVYTADKMVQGVEGVYRKLLGERAGADVRAGAQTARESGTQTSATL
jgi:glycosyltransferase involved in cell wall biosynthesis